MTEIEYKKKSLSLRLKKNKLKKRNIILKQRIESPLKLQPLFGNLKRHNFLYGGRGGGKSFTISKRLLKEGNERYIKVLCTREIQNSIKDSVHSLLAEVIQIYNYSNYVVTEKSIYNKVTGTKFIFAGLYLQDKKQTLKSYSDLDYAWIEEAQSASSGSLKILIPTIRKENSKLIYSFNRLLPSDPVWVLQERTLPEDKLVIKINWYDNKNFLSKTLKKDAEKDLKDYENGIENDYRHIWEGEPIQLSDRTIIRLDDVIGAIARDIEPEGAIEVGADIARYGSDRTIFFKRKGLKIIDYVVYTKQSTMDTARALIDFVDNDTSIKIKIDDTGIGGAVTDYLEEFGFDIDPITFNQRANDPDRFDNAISEMWFTMKNLMKEIDIPDIEDLKNELVSREWKLDKKGRRVVESKDEYKKKGFRSPDWADALLLTYYETNGDVGLFIRR